MAAFFIQIFLAYDAGAGTGWSEWLGTIAKIVNLLLFIGVAIYFLRRPLSETLTTRREGIRRELMRAQEDRNAALAKLSEVEARLSKLDAEVESVRAQANREAEEERARIQAQTEEDARKLSAQAKREIESASKAARSDLRSFVAEQSVLLAEELIRRDLRADDDSRLVNRYVEELGGVKG